MKLKIRRKCKCGCGKVVNPGNKYILGHNRRTKYPIRKIRRRCKCGCRGITNPGNKYIHGHHNRKGNIRKIKRRCRCGCGGITNPGRKYINGHHSFGNTYGRYNKGIKKTEEAQKNMSISQMGNANAKGCKHSKESKLKRSLSKVKYDPDYPYCDSWKSKEYRNDLRKDYCENIGCKGNYNQLQNHHIDLDKKNCHPFNIITLCASCHSILHRKIEDGKSIVVNPKDFLIINKPDHISYINKRTRKIVTIRRINAK